MRKISFVTNVFFSFLLLLTVFSCTEKYPALTEDSNTSSLLVDASGCEECHLDEALLQKVATPLLPSNGSGGEG